MTKDSQKSYSEDIMDWDVLGHSHDQRNLGLNGFLDGLRCLVAGHVDGRGIRLSSLLGLESHSQSNSS